MLYMIPWVISCMRWWGFCTHVHSLMRVMTFCTSKWLLNKGLSIVISVIVKINYLHRIYYWLWLSPFLLLQYQIHCMHAMCTPVSLCIKLCGCIINSTNNDTMVYIIVAIKQSIAKYCIAYSAIPCNLRTYSEIAWYWVLYCWVSYAMLCLLQHKCIHNIYKPWTHRVCVYKYSFQASQSDIICFACKKFE